MIDDSYSLGGILGLGVACPRWDGFSLTTLLLKLSPDALIQE